MSRIIRFSIIFIPPFLLCAYFFPLFLNFEFTPSANTDRKLITPNKTDLVRSIIADMLQTKTSVAWYKVCLYNRSYAIEDGQRVSDEKLAMRSKGIQINITSVNENHEWQLLTPPGEDRCIPVFIDSAGVVFSDFTVDYKMTIDLKRHLPNGGQLSMGNSPIVIKNSFLGWSGRYLLLLIAWGGLFLLTREIYNYIKCGRINNRAH